MPSLLAYDNIVLKATTFTLPLMMSLIAQITGLKPIHTPSILTTQLPEVRIKQHTSINFNIGYDSKTT
jgi:hypothetical protein